jgi:hypothetical protein
VSKKYFRTNPPITLVQQMISLNALYTGSKCFIKNDTLHWYGKIRPTSLSRTYSVKIIFNYYQPIEVLVYGDELQKLDNINFPHKYNIDVERKVVQICLYRSLNEFSIYKFISKTIIPWTVEWLYYYEIWLSTDKWFGGGEHIVSI